MRKVILYASTSLDGYIAKVDGGVDWCFIDQDYGYRDFYRGIDTTLIGSTTYEQIVTFDPRPFEGKVNYIFSRRASGPLSDPISCVQTLKQQPGQDIWLVGGAQLNTALLNANLIDELILSIHPILLGNGIPLFAEGAKEQELRLLAHRVFDTGLVQAHYALG
jgi:dihydrofolate reductase